MAEISSAKGQFTFYSIKQTQNENITQFLQQRSLFRMHIVYLNDGKHRPAAMRLNPIRHIKRDSSIWLREIAVTAFNNNVAHRPGNDPWQKDLE